MWILGSCPKAATKPPGPGHGSESLAKKCSTAVISEASNTKTIRMNGVGMVRHMFQALPGARAQALLTLAA